MPGQVPDMARPVRSSGDSDHSLRRPCCCPLRANETTIWIPPAITIAKAMSSPTTGLKWKGQYTQPVYTRAAQTKVPKAPKRILDITGHSFQ